MAQISYDEAVKQGQNMTVTSPDGRAFDGQYCDPKLDRMTMPEGVYAYDIRHDDDGCGIFVELCHGYVTVNNAGTFFTNIPIPELEKVGSSVSFAIDPEEWKTAHESETEPVVSSPTDWDYTF